MVIRTTMYCAYFEMKVHLNGEPIGRTIELSDPDIYPAISDAEAIEKAFKRAELVEYIKSLRIRKNQSDKKILVRLKEVVRKDKSNETIFTPKYRGGFKNRA